MGRSVKKGPFVQPKLLKRVEEMNQAGEKKIVKTWSRSSTILRSGGSSCTEKVRERITKEFSRRERISARICTRWDSIFKTECAYCLKR